MSTISEVLENCRRNEEKLFSDEGFEGVSVDIEKEYITLEGYYHISLDRLSSRGKILHWVAHLLAKNWVTREHLYWLVRVAADFHDINVFDGDNQLEKK